MRAMILEEVLYCLWIRMGPWHGQNQCLVCRELRAFPGLGTFSAETGPVPGKLGRWPC